MKTYRTPKYFVYLLLTGLLLLLAACSQAPTPQAPTVATQATNVIYVVPGGTGDGSSWSTAKTWRWPWPMP